MSFTISVYVRRLDVPLQGGFAPPALVAERRKALDDALRPEWEIPTLSFWQRFKIMMGWMEQPRPIFKPKEGLTGGTTGVLKIHGVTLHEDYMPPVAQALLKARGYVWEVYNLQWEKKVQDGEVEQELSALQAAMAELALQHPDFRELLSTRLMILPMEDTFFEAHEARG